MRFLVVKTSSLGDIIQSFSVVAFLKKHFPDSTIDWVVEKSFCELLESHPNVDRVIPIEARKWRKSLIKSYREIFSAFKELRVQKYHLLVDLQGNTKSSVITGFARSEKKVGYSFSSAPEWPGALFLSNRYSVNQAEPIAFQYLSLLEKHFNIKRASFNAAIELKITPSEASWIEDQLTGIKRPLLMVCLGSHWENKKLSLSAWKAFLTKIEEQLSPYFFFVWGTEQEKEDAETLQKHFQDSSCVVTRMRLPLWQRFIDRMDALLTVDSGALHLAGTTSTPTFSVFGPSRADIYKPIGLNHHAFQGKCPYNASFTKRCPVLRTCKTGACLKEISPDALARKFQSCLGRAINGTLLP